MAMIAKGKTEGEHRAEMQSRAASKTKPSKQRNRGLPKKDINEIKKALQEVEETKGDFSKDH